MPFEFGTQRVVYYQALFLKVLREGEGEDDRGEGKFGLVPQGIDPNQLLNPPVSVMELGEGLKPHPLLARSQQFSGVDRKLTAVPLDNTTARELYPQLRHQNQLRQAKRNSIKFRPY